MKRLFTILIFLSTLLNADEMQRIDSLVQEITQLKNDYKISEKKYIEKIVYLESQLNKEKEINKTKESKKKNIKRDLKVCLNNQIVEDDNPFPKLKNKKKFQVQKRKIENFKASSFRVNIRANIYNEIDGAVINSWEDRTSFTSHIRSSKWVKITGYFVDKKWRASDKEMWIRSCDVIDRNKVSH